MTTTGQITLPSTIQPTSVVMRLRSPSKSDVEAALERLSTIIESVGNQMYKTWNDPLSYDLLEWGATVLVESVKVENSDELLDEEALMENINNHLNKLINVILIDFLEKTPLKNPVLITETGWTLERFFVELSDVKISGKPVTMVTHDLAVEMLGWIASLYTDSSSTTTNNTNSQAISPVTNTQQNQNNEEMQSIMRSFASAYRTKAQQTAMIQKLGKKVLTAKTKSEEFKLMMAIIEERSEKRLQIQIQNNSEKEKVLENRMGHLEQVTEEKVEILASYAVTLEKMQKQSDAEIIALKGHTARQQHEIGSLKCELHQRTLDLEQAARNQKERDKVCTLF